MAMDEDDNERPDVYSPEKKKLKVVKEPVNYDNPNNQEMENQGAEEEGQPALNDPDDPRPAEALMYLGIDLNARDSYGRTQLHYSAIYNTAHKTNRLLKYGADVNIQDAYNKTPLHYACSINTRCMNISDKSLVIVKSLLQNGARVNLLSCDLETPLMLATRCLLLDITTKLLQVGADVHIRNNKSQTCLHILAGNCEECSLFRSNTRISIYRELFKKGACAECLDGKGKTALDIILQSRRVHKITEAKAFVKYATLFNGGEWTDFPLNISNIVKEFKKNCSEEITRMKSIQCSPNFSFCDFTRSGVNGTHHNGATGKLIVDTALQIMAKQDFPIYNDLAMNNFKRSYLCEEISKMKIYAKTETSEAFLYPDVIKIVCSYLSKKQLFKFLIGLKSAHLHKK